MILSEFQYFPEGCAAKGSLEVNEGDEKVVILVELPGFFNNELDSRNVVGGGTIWHYCGLCLLLVAGAWLRR